MTKKNCVRCGTKLREDDLGYNYCPNCGKLVDNEEDSDNNMEDLLKYVG